MFHRPSLMPHSMKSTYKTSNSPKQTGSPDHYLTTAANAGGLDLPSFPDDEEIIIVEPTDPDEDRLKEQQQQIEAKAKQEAPVIKQEDNTRVKLLSGNLSQQQNQKQHNPTISSLPQTTQFLVDQSKGTATVISLNETLQSLLSCTNRAQPVSAVSIQPILTNKLCTTPNLLSPCIVSSPLGTVLVQAPAATNQPPVTTNLLDESTSSLQTMAPLNPLIAAVLVNCATVNMISQLAGSICTPVYTGSAPTNSTITQPTVLGSLLSNLLSNIPLTTTVSSQLAEASTTTTTSIPAVITHSTPKSSQDTNAPLLLGSATASSDTSDSQSPTTVTETTETSPMKPSNGRIKRFKCPMPNCDMAFYSRFNQTEHIRCHTGERPFNCPEPDCPAAFKRRRDLRDHWNMHFLSHPNSSSPPEEANNDEREDEFMNGSASTGSPDDEPVKESYSATNTTVPASTCTTTAATLIITSSLPSAVGSNTFRKVEPPVSAGEGSMGLSIRPMIEPGRYHCPFAGCDKSYARRHRLNQHVSTHTGAGPIECDQPNCHVRYFSEEDLRRHKLSHQYASDKDARRRHQCPYPNCDKAYSKLNKLKEHVRSHTGERPYVCREPGCGAAFIRLYGVRRHELTHIFGRKRVKRYSQTSPVNGTSAVHKMEDVSTSATPVVTSVVVSGAELTVTPASLAQTVVEPSPQTPVTAISTVSLPTVLPKPEVLEVKVDNSGDTHANSVTTRVLPVIAPKMTTPMNLRPISPISGTPGMRRPHICPFKECGKAFPKLNKLREHICRHTGERPFVCSKCQSSFVRMYDLRRHSKIHLRGSEPRYMPRRLAPRPSDAEQKASETAIVQILEQSNLDQQQQTTVTS
ncbi:unnamed protein product [Calicophoron daubneyi]|uniref:C2H2-type domain-containing protein n=1 Tax=Calicophoron daubneyi TaxID=300641 RepID=A0AAV2T3S0_CALDB